jgi:hypothetical protein
MPRGIRLCKGIGGKDFQNLFKILYGKTQNKSMRYTYFYKKKE